MAHEVNLGGTIYISSKLAAEKTGYTQDYIGQLARGASIDGRRISGMWYVSEESLRAYKEKADQFVPTPPQGFAPAPEIESAVSFDGRDYVSAHRAAKLTGYHQDYVGQLARSGQILSRQIGNRWYVDRESLLKHKNAKDALLAAVQAESVGLAKPQGEADMPATSEKSESETHFSYRSEENPLIPAVEKTPEDVPAFPKRKIAEPVFESYSPEKGPQKTPVSMEEVPVPLPEGALEEKPAPEPFETPPEPVERDISIPIRIIAPQREIEASNAEINRAVPLRKNGRGGIFALSGLAVAAVVGTLAYIGASAGLLRLDSVSHGLETGQNAAAAGAVVQNGTAELQKIARALFAKELIYKRQ